MVRLFSKGKDIKIIMSTRSAKNYSELQHMMSSNQNYVINETSI